MLKEVSTEKLEEIKQLVIEALNISFKIHDSLGESGEEVIEKNRFGDTALKVDIDIESAIIDYLKKSGLSLQVISEEHGTTEISSNPQFLAIMDGLDGSGLYKNERGKGRYATMFGIFLGENPHYQDYLVCGIAEHAKKKIYLAVRDLGSELIENKTSTPIKTSGITQLSKKTQIRVDDFFPTNSKIFSGPLKKSGYITTYDKSSAIYYADVASGKADLALECTRKGNLEIAISYGLIHESSGVIFDINGHDLGPKLYREFGQQTQLPIITAATDELAKDLMKFLEKNKGS
ncbi:MAG: inositol monophosphatase family protein [Candidatus Berkelbacteria bacterium]